MGIMALLRLNPFASILGGVSLLLLIGIGVQTYRIESFKTNVAEAKAEQAKAVSQLDSLRADIATSIANNARALAEQEQKNSTERADLERERNTLQATLNQKQKEYNTVSTQLRSILTNAKDGVPISASSRSYFAGLRIQQQQWHGEDGTAPTGNRN